MTGLSLPLRLHPALVVDHLDPAVRHLPDAQHLKHQDSKRPDIAPEQTVYTNLKLYQNNPHRLVNSLMKRASGAVHLMGSFSLTTLILLGGRANPKSATFGNTSSRDFEFSPFSFTFYLCSVKSVEKNIPERGQIRYSSLLCRLAARFLVHCCTIFLCCWDAGWVINYQVPRFPGETGEAG